MHKTSPRAAALALVAALHLGLSDGCRAGGTDPFLGQILWVPYSFTPANWMSCDGQLLPIAPNMALFALLGTRFGGDGVNNFALPDMRGRVLVNAGQAPGLSAYAVGASGGEATHTLTVNEMPMHRHTLMASSQTATLADPANHTLAAAASGNLYSTSADTTLAAGGLSTAGGGQAHNNMMPYTTLRCIIAVAGTIPVHN